MNYRISIIDAKNLKPQIDLLKNLKKKLLKEVSPNIHHQSRGVNVEKRDNRECPCCCGSHLTITATGHVTTPISHLSTSDLGRKSGEGKGTFTIMRYLCYCVFSFLAWKITRGLKQKHNNTRWNRGNADYGDWWGDEVSNRRCHVKRRQDGERGKIVERPL